MPASPSSRARSGARTLLHDPIPAGARAAASQKLKDGFEKDAARGRLSAEQAQAGVARLEAVEDMAAFADCELVIEAAPERLELKHEIYARPVGDRQRGVRAGDATPPRCW